MDFGPFRRHHIQMQKRLLFLVALALIGLAMQAGAQSLNGGSQDCSDPLQHGSSACSGTQQNGSADCSDPMMKGSTQCAQGSNGSRSMGLQNGSQGQNSPLQQLTNQIYQDSNLAAPQPRPTDSVITFGEGWKSVAVREFQRHAIALAEGALDEVPPAQRDISHLTLSLGEASFRELQERLALFRKEALTLARQERNPDRVVMLNLSLFPVGGGA